MGWQKCSGIRRGYLDEWINEWTFPVFIIILLAIIIPSWAAISNYIESKCIWDEVTIDDEKIQSNRYGCVMLADIRMLKVSDLSKVFSFKIKTDELSLKFSCLDILGDDGGEKYAKDKESLKSMASEIERITKTAKFNTKTGKESTSNLLFAVICLAMLMLIPGLIFAPQRVAFVIPLIVPMFFYTLKKRKDNKNS